MSSGTAETFSSHNSAILKILISVQHSDWSVPGNTVHPGDAFTCTIPVLPDDADRPVPGVSLIKT